MDVMSNFAARYERTREEVLSLQDYLGICKREPVAYASAAERMLKAIGEPQLVDTRTDTRLSRIFANKVIKLYPAFTEFYGMEDAIEQVVSYFRHAAQGLEEKKQILYLLGPVGGGKSSIAERLKQLMEHVPFYAIKDSPVNESPLGLFDALEDGEILEKEYLLALHLAQYALRQGPAGRWVHDRVVALAHQRDLSAARGTSSLQWHQPLCTGVCHVH